MRQFVTWQFWLSLVVLAAMFGGLWLIVRDDGQEALIAAPTGGETFQKDEQPIDLIALVYAAQADPGFAFVDGRSTARVVITIDGYRYMDIPAGTPGENRCPNLDQLAQCVVAADTLGNAVLWFSILPNEPRNLITLPALDEFRDGSKVRLENGWVVRHAPVLERETEECGVDTISLRDFLERVETHTSTFNMDEQRITTVTCLTPVET